MDWQLYKTKLWASYGNWKNPEPGTLLAANIEWAKAFKEAGVKARYEPYYGTYNAVVKSTDKYNYLEWSFDSITTDNIRPLLEETLDKISEYNQYRFKWINLDGTSWTLSYAYKPLLLDAPSNSTPPKQLDTDTDGISIEDVPF